MVERRVRIQRSWALRLWLLLTLVCPWLFKALARRVHQKQNGPRERLRERYGIATSPRPEGRLIWIHAASVGEVNSIVEFAQKLLDDPGANLLLTTTTVTGGETVQKALPGAVHQFLPIDTPGAISKFLDHWRPDLALFVEGDLWPRLVLSLKDHRCPFGLLNARASRSRERQPALYREILAHVALVTVQESRLMADFTALGVDATTIHEPGNLKADIQLPQVDDALCAAMSKAAVGRGAWAAVSTHPGEEAAALDAHMALSQPPLLLLVPRHPNRRAEVEAELVKRGLNYTLHSADQRPNAETQVHLVDAIGLTGSVFAVSDVVFMGGSLEPGIGGHTPFEPAGFGCAILAGPYVDNFKDAYRELQDAGAGHLTLDGLRLRDTLETLLRDDTAVAAMQDASRAYSSAGRGAAERTVELVLPLLADVRNAGD